MALDVVEVGWAVALDVALDVGEVEAKVKSVVVVW